jgi:hypothetical protein
MKHSHQCLIAAFFLVSNVYYPLVQARLLRKNKVYKKCPKDSEVAPGASCAIQDQTCNYNALCFQLVNPTTLECIDDTEVTVYLQTCYCSDFDEGLKYQCDVIDLRPEAMACGNPYCL